ncbi:MAG: YitT family protein [Candidatus Krumholzibacteriota bacterium]|nr:YitT family protein [Candidatus Krumholzibacteriota bacterium]
MKRRNMESVVDYAAITVGSFVMAIGIGVFLVDAKVVPGGVSGLSMAVHYLTDGRVPVGLLMWCFNVPLFVWGVKELGRAFGVRTFYGFTANSFFIDLVRGDVFSGIRLQDTATIRFLVERDFFFLVLLGAVLIGLGLGIIFKFKGTTAGSDIVAAIAQKRWNVKPGTTILVVDFFVILAAGIVIHARNLSPETPAAVLMLYAFFLLFVSSQLIDMVIFGFDYAKSALIISDRHEEIAEMIIDRLGRGATALHGRGLYSGRERDVIFTVVPRRQIYRLADQVKQIDPDAFVIINRVHEVLGEGFMARGEVDRQKLVPQRRRGDEETAS